MKPSGDGIENPQPSWEAFPEASLMPTIFSISERRFTVPGSMFTAGADPARCKEMMGRRHGFGRWRDSAGNRALLGGLVVNKE